MTAERAAKPTLLFISPVFPDTRGNGLAMRAGMFLQALSTVSEVYLLVVALYPGGGESSQRLIEGCADWGMIPPLPVRHTFLSRLAARFRPRPAVIGLIEANTPGVRDVFPGVSFDIVHVFRLSMWPVAQELLRRGGVRPSVHLDLDDIESETLTKIAALYRSNGDDENAGLEEYEAELYKAVERGAVAAADRTYVCSEDDRRLLTSLYRTKEVEVVPNAIALPEAAAKKDEASRPFRFLFVGTLGYYPNSDALVWFQREVAPLLRARADLPFQLDIVGVGISAEVQALAEEPGVNFVGQVEDVGESYAAADAVLIPLRAGGGTRIKALEAFAYRRPVVTTAIGIHGINAVPERDVLIGDTPQAFAAQCLRVMEDGGLRESLAEASYGLVTGSYRQAVIEDRVRSLFAQPR